MHFFQGITDLWLVFIKGSKVFVCDFLGHRYEGDTILAKLEINDWNMLHNPKKDRSCVTVIVVLISRIMSAVQLATLVNQAG